MSPQLQVLNHVVPLLIEQGEPAFDYNTDTCRYRGPNNTKCAVGHLIPDDKYDEDIEEKLAFQQPVTERLPDFALAAGIDFLRDLQVCHDDPALAGLTGPEWVQKFKDQINALADNYQVNFRC